MNDLEVDVSLVVPMYNEADNVERVVPELLSHAMRLDRGFEIVIVNDGSTDGTAGLLDEQAEADPRIKIIHFVRNFGQTAAMAAGFQAARGEIIVPLDGDGQNEAGDIGKLIDILEAPAKPGEEIGCVSGWRKQRKDNPIRVIPSRIANAIISRITGVHLHDYGCSLKAFRAKYLQPAQLYGEMHRFLPVYAAMHGARVTEVEVGHHARTAGVSKYGLGRTFRVFTDLFLLRLLQKYSTRPSHFIGKFAWAAWGVGAVATFLMLLTNLTWGGLLAAMATAVAFVFLGLVFVAIGLTAELVVRARYEAARHTPWEVARRVNFEDAAERELVAAGGPANPSSGW